MEPSSVTGDRVEPSATGRSVERRPSQVTTLDEDAGARTAGDVTVASGDDSHASSSGRRDPGSAPAQPLDAPDQPTPLAPRSRLPIERLGDYRLIREIGRGGMGVVYEAEQESLGRRVALKVLPAGALATSSHLARFEREAKSAARLHHTNIVPIYGVGRQDGLHYYVMQFIDGCGLDRVIEELRRQQGGSGGGASDPARLLAPTEHRDLSAADAARTLLAPGGAARPLEPPGSLDDSTDEAGTATELIPGEPQVAARAGDKDATNATIAGDEPDPDGLTTIAEKEVPFAAHGVHGAGDATISEEDSPPLGGVDGLSADRTLPEFTPLDEAPTEHDGDFTRDELDPTVSLAGTAEPQARAFDEAPTVTSRAELPRVARAAPPAALVSLRGDSEAGRVDDSEQAGWRSVARIGVQVADALAYAHRNGTLHRDVKPANLLLDRHGRVWVTDFGLAKAAGSEDLTQTGDIVGTIRYMAPERFEGGSDARSDLYSLGLTLYELLARRPAYDETGRNQLIAQVMKQAPPPLSSVDPSIPRDLATIVHKTIERDPVHRYQTARELADDLQRFLDDRPILARQATLSERLWRWSRRNPALAGLSAAVIALLVLLTLGSFWAAMHFREQAARTREALGEAERQRTWAEENFAQARAAVDEALVHISENQLLQVPGFQPLRKELLEASLKYYQWFVQRRADDPTLRDDLAESWFRLGEINAEIGATRDALAHFQQAQTLREELLERAGDDGPARQAQLLELARTHGRIGELQHALERHDGALASFEAARDLWRELGRDGYDEALVQPSLAETFNGAGRVLTAQGNPTDALHCYREALKILQRHADRDPRNAQVQFSLARVHASVALLEQRIGLAASALASYGKAQSALTALLEAHPRHRLANQFREDLAECHENIGGLRVRDGQSDAALAAWRASLALLEELARDNPAVLKYTESLPRAYSRLVVLHAGRDEWDEALRLAGLAEQHWERRAPADAGGWYDLARVRAIRASAAAGGHESDPSEPADELAAAAVAALTRATDAGFRDPERLAGDPAFAGLREHAEFVSLLRRLQGARQAIDWTDDFELAQVRAARDGKDLFVYFSGEDWCPWCAVLRNGVFNEPEFLDRVPERFVMVQLDAPQRGPRPASWPTREQLRTRWGLRNAVPRFVLCDAAGRPYFEMSTRPTTANEWVEFLDRLQEIRAERDRHLAEAEALTGLDRARALDRALRALEQDPAPPRRARFISDESDASDDAMEGESASSAPKKFLFSVYSDLFREILELDADNQAGLKARYEQIVQPWWVAGPYPGELAAAYPPEEAHDPHAPIPAAGDLPERAWKPTLAPAGDAAINFQEFFGSTDHSSAYALTFVDSPGEREAVLLVGSDDTVRVWLNGELVHEHRQPRAAAPDQDLVPVTLAAGRNVILAKVVNVDRGHLLYCRVSHEPLDLARAWMRRGQRETAAAWYERAVEDDPEAWRPRIERGGFYAESARWDDAEQDFQAALAGAERRLVGDHIGRVCYHAGRRFETAGRHADAVRAYGRAVEELTALMREAPSPSFQGKLKMIQERLAQVLLRSGRLDELDELVRSSLDPATLANNLGWRLATSADPAERDPELAVKFASRAVELAPGNGAFWNTLGVAEYRAGRWGAAVTALTKSMSLRDGGDGHDWVFLAMAHWHLGSRDAALSWYRRFTNDFVRRTSDQELRRFLVEAAELLGTGDPLLRSRAHVLLGEWQQAEAGLTALIERQPNNAAARIARGELHARFTRWQQAADDFAAALEINPADHWHWYRSACLRLKLGDREGYLRHCRELLERFGETDRPFIAERVAKICLLVPAGAEAVGEAPLKLAEFAVTGTEQDELYPYYLLVKGIADYRAGRFEAAAEACRRSFERYTNPYPRSLAALFGAMACHRGGQAEEAARWLAEADQILQTRLAAESTGHIGPGWHDWIMPHVVREEAAAVFSASAGEHAHEEE